jgi:hypothetical protein
MGQMIRRGRTGEQGISQSAETQPAELSGRLTRYRETRLDLELGGILALRDP